MKLRALIRFATRTYMRISFINKKKKMSKIKGNKQC